MAMDTTDYYYVGRDQQIPILANRLRNGFGTLFDREDASSSALATVSQTLYLTFFTAKMSFQSANVAVPSGGTAAGATPTLVRYGLYSVDGLGNLTLIASTVNDTAVFAAANTYYSKAWSAPVNINNGQRYALGVLVVTAAATPTLNGVSVPAVVAASAPRLCGQFASQADLPTSIPVASVANGSNMVYGEIRS